MDIAFATQFGPISESKIARFEAFAGITLPRTYRDFLLKYNGGVPANQKFVSKYRPGADHFYIVHTLLPIGTRKRFGFDNLKAYFETYKTKQWRVPDEMIPIAGDLFGNLFCLVVTGPNTGKIYFWNHEREPGASDEEDELECAEDGLKCEVEGFPNMTLIADSFEEFIHELEPL
jgi:hypothetical protein